MKKILSSIMAALFALVFAGAVFAAEPAAKEGEAPAAPAAEKKEGTEKKKVVKKKKAAKKAKAKKAATDNAAPAAEKAPAEKK